MLQSVGNVIGRFFVQHVLTQQPDHDMKEKYILKEEQTFVYLQHECIANKYSPNEVHVISDLLLVRTMLSVSDISPSRRSADLHPIREGGL